METIIATGGVFLGCMSNAIFLELLIKADPGCGTLVTFCQFLFIAFVGFITTSNFGTAKRVIPIKNYVVIVALFFICNVCNNYAFNFNIAMPLHMIFRSGSLITNMITSVIILKRNYAFSKYVSVGLITVGVIICTLASGQEMFQKESDEPKITEDAGSFFWWLMGIGLLVFGLLISSLLGIFQESLFTKYGKHPREALFYTHLLPLPLFFLFSNNLVEHISTAVHSELIDTPTINYKMPSIILYLIGNVVTQYLCISSVYYLTAEATTLTVTLVITLRKFVSLLLSIVYFQNAFTFYHWLGTILVFVGTVIFTEITKTIKK